MSKLFRKRKPQSADDVRYCFQVNNDDMLFFPTESEMMRYLHDYRKRIPIHKLVMFRVEFYKMK